MQADESWGPNPKLLMPKESLPAAFLSLIWVPLQKLNPHVQELG